MAREKKEKAAVARARYKAKAKEKAREKREEEDKKRREEEDELRRRLKVKLNAAPGTLDEFMTSSWAGGGGSEVGRPVSTAGGRSGGGGSDSDFSDFENFGLGDRGAKRRRLDGNGGEEMDELGTDEEDDDEVAANSLAGTVSLHLNSSFPSNLTDEAKLGILSSRATNELSDLLSLHPVQTPTHLPISTTPLPTLTQCTTTPSYRSETGTTTLPTEEEVRPEGVRYLRDRRWRLRRSLLGGSRRLGGRFGLSSPRRTYQECVFSSFASVTPSLPSVALVQELTPCLRLFLERPTKRS